MPTNDRATIAADVEALLFAVRTSGKVVIQRYYTVDMLSVKALPMSFGLIYFESPHEFKFTL